MQRAAHGHGMVYEMGGISGLYLEDVRLASAGLFAVSNGSVRRILITAIMDGNIVFILSMHMVNPIIAPGTHA